MTANEAKEKTKEALEMLVPYVTKCLFNNEIESEVSKGNCCCCVKNKFIIYRLDKTKAEQVTEILNYYSLLGYEIHTDIYEDFYISWK